MPRRKSKENLNETVYRAIREMIALNRFKPGLRLNAERLSRELGASRTPVWKAIRRLEKEGVVRRVPDRGVFMVENSLERVREQILVLNALDHLATGLACERMNENILSKLSMCLADQLRGIEAEDLARFGTAEMQFHRLIYGASGVSYLKEIFDLVASQLLPSSLNFVPALPAMYMSNDELMQALMDQNIGRVREATDRHTQAILDAISEQMRSRTALKEMVRKATARRPPSGKIGSKKKSDRESQEG